MTLVTKVSLFSLLVVLAAVGCDSNPTAPSPGFDGTASQSGTVGVQGATLTGRFLGNGQSSKVMGTLALVSASDDLTAIVLDSLEHDRTEIARVKVVNGRFTLRGLPEFFFLVFENAKGDPLGDPIRFDGIKPNQEIDIVLDVQNGSVVLLEEKRTGIDHEGASGIEIEGSVRSISVGSDPMTGSLEVRAYNEVMAYNVVTRAAETAIRKGNRSLTLEDLSEGDRVHVRGVFEDAADGSRPVLAHEIKLQDDDDVELGGSQVICHIPPGNPANKKTLTVPAEDVAGHLGHGDHLGPCN